MREQGPGSGSGRQGKGGPKLRDVGERRLIAEIRKKFRGGRPDVPLGIGDDAAMLRASGTLLVTTDILVEDRDFRKKLHPPRLLGRKALNVNLSDIAAMGGRPLHALLGLALPAGTSWDWTAEFLAGFRAAAREAGVVLVGGDVSEAREIVISVTVTGTGPRAVRRSGAQPGDWIFVSGTLGDAAMGLRLIEKGGPAARSRGNSPLIRAFLDPGPRLELGRRLAAARLASAMIDVSDGLSVDMSHICEESGVGAEIRVDRIPMSAALRRAAGDPLGLALHGGEDFELLFTVRPGKVRSVLGLADRFPLTAIGQVVRGRDVWAVDSAGKVSPLGARGYEHFR